MLLRQLVGVPPGIATVAVVRAVALRAAALVVSVGIGFLAASAM